MVTLKEREIEKYNSKLRKVLKLNALLVLLSSFVYLIVEEKYPFVVALLPSFMLFTFTVSLSFVSYVLFRRR